MFNAAKGHLRLDSREKDKNRKDNAFWRQSNEQPSTEKFTLFSDHNGSILGWQPRAEQPSIIPGCPGAFKAISVSLLWRLMRRISSFFSSTERTFYALLHTSWKCSVDEDAHYMVLHPPTANSMPWSTLS